MFDEMTLAQKIHHVYSHIGDLGREITTLKNKIDYLTDQGCSNAHEWWKDGKYLYLVYPTDKNGKRNREYVGSDPAMIDKAMKSIERYNQRRALREELSRLEDVQRQIKYHAERAIMAMKGVQGTFEGMGE